MPNLSDTLAGGLELLRLAALSGFRVRNRYWRWRYETAFGAGEPPRRERIAAFLRYAAWARRMRLAARRE